MSKAAAATMKLSEYKAAWLPFIRIRRSQLQQVARYRRDDPSFPWRKWAKAVVNESLFLKSGVYDVGGDRQIWASPNAAAALCYGKNAPFSLISEVPPDILAEVEAGAARARKASSCRHLLVDGETLGRQIGMTWALREKLCVWLIWPDGAKRADLEARRKERRAARREKDRFYHQAARRADGAVPREQFISESIAEQARKLGITPNALRARLWRKRHPRLSRDPRNTSVAANYSYNMPADGPVMRADATKRDSIAAKARELGIKPNTLRARLRRAKAAAAAFERQFLYIQTDGRGERRDASNTVLRAPGFPTVIILQDRRKKGSRRPETAASQGAGCIQSSGRD